MKFYRSEPDPDIASLKERFNAAQKYTAPADRYMAISDVFIDTFGAYSDRMMSRSTADIFYPNTSRTAGLGIIIGGIIGAIVAPHIVAGIAIGAVLGFGGGTFGEFGRIAIADKFDKKRQELEDLVGDIQKSMKHVKESDLTLQLLQQSPLFGDFSKKYPDLVDTFRMAALRKEQDAALVKQGAAPATPPKDAPGLSL